MRAGKLETNDRVLASRPAPDWWDSTFPAWGYPKLGTVTLIRHPIEVMATKLDGYYYVECDDGYGDWIHRDELRYLSPLEQLGAVACDLDRSMTS